MPLLPHSVEGKSAPFLARVENVLDQLDTLKGEYMAACKAKRADIKQIYKDAKEDEIPVGALKGLVSYRVLARRQEKLAESVPDDEMDDFQMLVDALGDFSSTELGQAALDLAGGGDDHDDPRPRFKKTEGEAPDAKPKGRKAKADAAPAPSPEEAAALAEVEAHGIAGAAGGVTAH